MSRSRSLGDNTARRPIRRQSQAQQLDMRSAHRGLRQAAAALIVSQWEAFAQGLYIAGRFVSTPRSIISRSLLSSALPSHAHTLVARARLRLSRNEARPQRDYVQVSSERTPHPTAGKLAELTPNVGASHTPSTSPHNKSLR